LLYASKQIRKEFFPIYMTGFDHTVKIWNLAAYAQAFPALPKGIIGTISIDLERIHAGRGSIDVAPFFHLRHQYQDITFALVSAPFDSPHRSWSFQTFCKLLVGSKATPSGDSKWLSYARGALKALWIMPTSPTSRSLMDSKFLVIAKSSCEEWWMGRFSEEYSQRCPLDWHEWATRTGFPEALASYTRVSGPW